MRKYITVCLALLLVVSLAVPASALIASYTPYVLDDAGLLTAQQRQELNGYADALAREYGIGIYMMAVEDYRDYGDGWEIYDVLWQFYHDHSLGCGSGRQGMILMLSMAERDYATFFYGTDTEYAFNGYAQEELEGHFLDDFAYDDWYGGFSDYLSTAETFLEKAAAGEPVREKPADLTGGAVLVAVLIALVATWVQWARMGNVAMQKGARQYQTGGLVLTRRTDRFLTRTVARRRIPRSTSGSGARVHSGGGGSGRSGKF